MPDFSLLVTNVYQKIYFSYAVIKDTHTGIAISKNPFDSVIKKTWNLRLFFFSWLRANCLLR